LEINLGLEHKQSPFAEYITVDVKVQDKPAPIVEAKPP
jgi:hypothetical protein